VIDATQARGKAQEYLQQFIPDFAALDPKVDEITLAPNGSTWIIGLYAYAGDQSQAATLAELLKFRRIRKVVVISAEDGSLLGISNPAPAALAS